MHSIEEIHDIQEELKRKAFLGDKLSELDENATLLIYDDTEMCLRRFKGKHVDVLKKRYSKMGINLDQITNLYEQ